ncbi:hypothetical protein [Alkalihalobacterium chitinilyticum]|uniref:Small, acid-soluble spore protein, alpha/beta type n=1 Tax=Alkalihalobacterium chitinilyticum TaxID=2980103 RepID=A0ABT5VI05_9BACI|nr:hypothetical protein [Alkalihalobacterium chitinilyticum]MDE5414947.1 hypothetical protein [Alkalihalobacterium chitinilyticum]
MEKDQNKDKFENANEDRANFFMDVDRMINEGLGGGTVSYENNSGIIEEARDLVEEEPPNQPEDERK